MTSAGRPRLCAILDTHGRLRMRPFGGHPVECCCSWDLAASRLDLQPVLHRHHPNPAGRTSWVRVVLQPGRRPLAREVSVNTIAYSRRQVDGWMVRFCASHHWPTSSHDSYAAPGHGVRHRQLPSRGVRPDTSRRLVCESPRVAPSGADAGGTSICAAGSPYRPRADHNFGMLPQTLPRCRCLTQTRRPRPSPTNSVRRSSR